MCNLTLDDDKHISIPPPPTAPMKPQHQLERITVTAPKQGSSPIPTSLNSLHHYASQMMMWMFLFLLWQWNLGAMPIRYWLFVKQVSEISPPTLSTNWPSPSVEGLFCQWLSCREQRWCICGIVHLGWTKWWGLRRRVLHNGWLWIRWDQVRTVSSQKAFCGWSQPFTLWCTFCWIQWCLSSKWFGWMKRINQMWQQALSFIADRKSVV